MASRVATATHARDPRPAPPAGGGASHHGRATARRELAFAGHLSGLVVLLLLAGRTVAQGAEISFYYPVAVGGPVTKIMDRLATAFERENPGLAVRPVYTGTYQETLAKALAAARSGDPPHAAIMLSTDIHTLVDADAVVAWDELVGSPDDQGWLDGFFPAFMLNSRRAGRTWGIPFQRSTIVLYWNKDAFREAGLDPSRPPATWAEQVRYAKMLTRRDAAGHVTRWGIQVPSSGFPYWLFQGFTTQNDVLLMNEAGTRTFFDRPAVIEALQYWVDLARTHQAMPPGTIDWTTTPTDFFEGRTAMMWNTTGHLTSVRNNARFPFGVAMLPAGKKRGSPTGGGNFYVFRRTTPAQRADAMKLVKWLTSPERAAEWGIETGYVAVRRDAWQTPAMRKYTAEFPAAAVARDQLQYAVAELSTHENPRVTQALNDGLLAALEGVKTPTQAMKDAQGEADRILRAYRR